MADISGNVYVWHMENNCDLAGYDIHERGENVKMSKNEINGTSTSFTSCDPQYLFMQGCIKVRPSSLRCTLIIPGVQP